MKDLVLAIDQGTTGSRAIIFNNKLEVLSESYSEFPQIFPKPGWVEHNPIDIWKSVEKTIKQALTVGHIDPARIAGIGITNQRETTIIWNRKTQNPVHNAIVWQCRRTAEICKKLKDQGKEPWIQKKTGLLLDPYFSGTKVQWLLENVKGLRKLAEAGDVAFGTIDCFLINRLTGGEVHATDASNASRTLLMNINTLKWDDEVLKLFGIPEAILPEIKDSSTIFGYTKGLDFLPDGIPIAGVAGDQQAALFGQACFNEGEAKCTYGTGSFILMNTGSTPVFSKHKLLTTVAWRIGGKTTYALEGSVFISGAAVQWLRDGLGIIKTSAEIEDLAASVEDSGGVVFVPALVGIGAPYWKADARGIIVGITRGTTKAHLARATLEAIALQNHDVLEAMAEDKGSSITILKVDGGAAQDNLLMQLQADLSRIEIIRPKVVEVTAIGAAMLAGLATGVWKSIEDLKAHWKIDRSFKPLMPEGEAKAIIARWKEAVSKL